MGIESTPLSQSRYTDAEAVAAVEAAELTLSNMLSINMANPQILLLEDSQEANEGLLAIQNHPNNGLQFTWDNDNLSTRQLIFQAARDTGVITFATVPILPSDAPTLDNQAARKAYVDGEISATEGLVDDVQDDLDARLAVYVASDDVLAEANTNRSVSDNDGPAEKLKEFSVEHEGVFRAKYTITSSGAGDSTNISIRVDGTEVATDSVTSGSSPKSASEDITVAKGELISYWLSGVTSGGNSSIDAASICGRLSTDVIVDQD